MSRDDERLEEEDDEEARDVARLRRSLNSEDRHERAWAAVGLGQAGDVEALVELESLAEDADDLVAVAASFAASRVGKTPRGVPRMAAALASEDEETMQLAVHALCELGGGVVDALESELAAGSPAKLEIVRVLSEMEGDAARRALERAAASSDPDVARAAREAVTEG